MFRNQRLTLDQQVYRMHLLYPSFGIYRRRRQAEVIWLGAVQATPLSQRYSVTLRLRPGWPPEVRVLSPTLRLRPGATRLPHTYKDGSLCLHTAADWRSSLFVADYVVPWISVWLYFYEVWLATGWWEGGGTHPDWPQHRSEERQAS